MQTVRKETINFDTSQNRFVPAGQVVPNPSRQINRLKISEFKSWALCFSLMSLITGLILFLKVGVTMEVITSTLFYLSLVGLIASVSRIIVLHRLGTQSKKQTNSLENKAYRELN